ncbi:hypothetical protein C5167_032366 [Papaver somniferum]|uniref:Eukaryotic translation initiation factor 4G n=1 Tax=Papaver somniferum TaxID=3469 RepID=A0A4Y7K7E4_PAPSO|nr:hypothetical protein C5167_032366 [Papaver somniferum]
MSQNQSRFDKNESHYKKPGRSGSSANQRNFSGGAGKGGGGSAPPQPSSSSPSLNNSSSSTNRSFKKSSNGQGGQPRTNAVGANSEPNVQRAHPQNGANVQPILHGAPDAPVSGASNKPSNAPAPRSNRPAPKAPSSQITAGASESTAPTTPAKGDTSNAFAFQFGSISPGFINGMQIPARTSSAPPNLDEQKRDQARHDSSGAVPVLPIPAAPKQQQPRKDLGKVNQPSSGESPVPNQAKRDVHSQGPVVPVVTTMQKPHVLPGTGMTMPYQQQQVPVVPFIAPSPQVQSQGVTASVQMPIPLPSNQMQQQLAPQLGNLPMGMAPQFAQQQGGKYGGTRKAVKITHPDTHEELRLDKRTDAYMDGGSSGTKSHSSVTPQSQPISPFPPAHQINYYPMPSGTYNPNNIFFQSQSSVPLSTTQMTTSSPAPRYNYPGSQGGPPTVSFKNPSALNPLHVNKSGGQMHVESLNSGQTHDTQALSGLAPAAAVDVTVKPAPGARGEKFSSSVTISSPHVSKGEAAKLLGPPKAAGLQFPHEMTTDYSVQQSKSVLEPVSSVSPSITIKDPSAASVSVSAQKLPSSNYSSSVVPQDESSSLGANAEGRRRENVRRSDSFKDHLKRTTKKDLQDSHSQRQENASDSVGASKSFSSVVSGEVAKRPESSQDPPSEVVKSSTSGSDASEELNGATNGEGSPSEPFSTCDLGRAKENEQPLEILVKEKSSPEPKSSDISEDNEHKDGSRGKEENTSGDSSSAEAEQVMGKTAACSSEDNMVTGDDLALASSDAINACTSVSLPVSRDIATAAVDSLTVVNETAGGIEVSMNDSGLSHPDPAPVLSPASSEVKSEFESKNTESSVSDSISTSGAVSKDKPELTRTKSNITAKAKKKRKDILKAADAAGSSSDLYNAYKGPEEKHEASEILDSSHNASSNLGPGEEAERMLQPEKDAESKAEPDDWEDAAEISTPKLKISDDGKQLDGDGSGGTSKKYSRDFLLTFSEQCNAPGQSAGRDPRMEPIRHAGGSSGGFRPQGGNHGVLRNPRGHPPGHYTGGILSGPMQHMVQQGGMPRNNSEEGPWKHARGLIPPPLTPLQIMHKAERKYEVGKASDTEEVKQRRLKAILNKLTPQNFEKLFEQVKEVNIDNAVTLTGVISQIFDKALMEPTFCEMYANFCFHLSSELPDFSENNERITFKRVLLNKCQEEFERGEREQAEADRVEEEGEAKMSAEEREEKRVQARRRMLGNIRLIGELYKKRMLTERIMHECITKLLGQYQNPDEEDIEALCKLMSTIGEMIDHPKAKDHMDAYFDMMLKLSNNMKLSSRVRFMLKDSIDLRRNHWRQRRKVEGPKKIEDVHRDAAQERQAQTSRLARGPSMGGGSARRQPMDFAPRSNMLSSPNSQMSGLRGMPPQPRGYGGQDARFEDRHLYESRPLTVPLSQRPIDDESITLGPQGGLARGMSRGGQPIISGVPLVDASPVPGDPRRFGAGPNGYSSMSEQSPYDLKEDLAPRYIPDRFSGIPVYDQSNSMERPTFFGNRDPRQVDRPTDRFTPPSARVQGSTTATPVVVPEKVWPEERLRDMSMSAIREFYSAKDEREVALCVKELNSPSFYPSMVSIWVTDSFERKDMERDLLANLLVSLNRSHDSLLTEGQLIKGFESVFSTLEDAVNDAPKAAEFLGRILGKGIMEKVVPLREIGRLIKDGGEEPGRLLELGLAAEVLGTILEMIKLEKGESVLNEIHKSSNIRLEDFRAPAPSKSRKLEAFM